MRRIKLIGLIMLVLLLAPALASAQMEAITIDLAEQNDSGISGTATLTPMGDQTEVVVTLESDMMMDTAHPNHIHTGTCENLGGVEYPLTDVTDQATTVVDVSLESLMTGDFAINVHKSADEMSVYVACGNIPAEAAAMMMPQTGGTSTSWLILGAAGLFLLFAGFATRRVLA